MRGAAGRAIAGLAVSALAGACAASGGGGGPEGSLSVIASFYPLAEAAQRVGGDEVQVVNLTPPGAEPHDLELDPEQVNRIGSADLVLYVGAGFQPGVEDAVATSGAPAVDLLDGVSLLRGQADEQPEGQGDEEAGSDPHIWLSPAIMGRVVDRLEAELAESYATGAERFAENARAYREEIDALDDDYRSTLSRCERDLIVTSHAAFGYLARDYGLVQVSVSGLSPEAEPDPNRLAELVDLVRAEGVTTVFSETLASPEVAAALAREAGVRTDVLNPIEGLTEKELEAGETYSSVMRANLDALAAALGCS